MTPIRAGARGPKTQLPRTPRASKGPSPLSQSPPPIQRPGGGQGHPGPKFSAQGSLLSPRRGPSKPTPHTRSLALPTPPGVARKLAPFPLSQGSSPNRRKLSVKRKPQPVVRRQFRSDEFPGAVLENASQDSPGSHLAGQSGKHCGNQFSNFP